MKLAEALNLRADLQKRIAQLKLRLLANAKVQEGDTPAEDPTLLLQELDSYTAQLEMLIRQINKANNSTVVSRQYRDICNKNRNPQLTATPRCAIVCSFRLGNLL